MPQYQSPPEASSAGFLVEEFSAGGLCPDRERRSIERRYAGLLEVTDRFNRQAVSYQLSKKAALHGWLKYKEGFSAGLVDLLLDDMGAQPGDWVMDPFMGSGTTALACQARGVNSIGYDIMPLSAVALEAKSAVLRYDPEELRALYGDIAKLDVPAAYRGRTPSIAITRDAYPEENAAFLQYIAQWRDSSGYSGRAKNLLTLCILNALERCSYTSKAGQYLAWDCRSAKAAEANRRRAEKGRPPLREKRVRPVISRARDAVMEELHQVIHDIAALQERGQGAPEARIEFFPESVLYGLPRLPGGFLKGVITSPPYCNRYDYTRTYALELVYLGLGEEEVKRLRQELLSCTVESRSKLESLQVFYESIGQAERFAGVCRKIQENAVFQEILSALEQRGSSGDLNNKGVLRMVEGYFTELAFTYAELYRLCRPGAMVAFVNDNVRYGGEVIPVDFLSCSFAEQFGFQVRKIYTLRQQKGNSSQQMAKFGRVPLRKSITIWTKP